MTTDNSELAHQIAAWADSPAEHARAAEALAALGTRAIPGLRDYLGRGPQVIPQPRCFAVAMLARLHAPAATDALRAVLHTHPLKMLTPVLAESEYVVKSDALEALCVRAYAARAADVAFGLHERLRVAVVAAGRMRRVELVEALVDMLDDDVLAAPAMDALMAMHGATRAAIASRLDAWLVGADLSARQRLALIRALRVLRRVGGIDHPALGRALADAHPAVRAAAALLAWPTQRNDALIEALLRGAIGFDYDLAEECREALDVAGPELCVHAGQALARNAEPSLYGECAPLSPEQRAWLIDRLQRCHAVRP